MPEVRGHRRKEIPIVFDQDRLAPPAQATRRFDTDGDTTARIVVLGRQGSGKGTQCARLAVRLGVDHVSTGALFRAAVVRDTTLGRSVAGYLDTGELVPDRLALDVVAAHLARSPMRAGFVLDGFPRNVDQARQLALLIGAPAVHVAINLAVDPRVVFERLLHRRVCSVCDLPAADSADSSDPRCALCDGTLIRRDDDRAPTIARRLAVHEREARPLLGWYASQGVLVTVDGLGTPDDVARRIEHAYSACRTIGL